MLLSSLLLRPGRTAMLLFLQVAEGDGCQC